MSFNRMLGCAFIVSLVVWAWFSWPLPRHVGSGIPAAAHREPADVQRMVPGDHLQFMYYCRLAGDMAAGRTPLFYNLYEFNTGDDRERFEPDAYYVPFSLVSAAGAALFGGAFGWNLAGFISLWLTYLLTWLLVRRWTRNACPAPAGEWLAAATALLGIALPFRWINLFGGSPAGFAMAWIPAILLGVDLAVREDRVGGGVLAGVAILMAAWGDQHVFFFGTLAAPAWGVVAFAARPDFPWRQGAAYRRLALALLPIALFAGAALLFPLLMKGLDHLVTGLAPAAHAVGPRTLREVLNYSPDWRGFFGMSGLAVSSQIYLGLTLLALIAAGWLTLLGLTIKHAFFRGNPQPPVQRSPLGGVGSLARLPALTAFRPLIVLTLIGLAILGVMLLALGARGPGHGALLEAVRAVIPPYAMIRQPAKIFCLLPSLLAVASALALAALVRLPAGGRSAPGRNAQAVRIGRLLLPAVLIGWLLLDYSRRTHPTLSLLEKKQEAYAAVAADASAAGAAPRALVIPLWPGDSHYASIYQYFAALYRVRMLNGYNPFIKKGYFENVFRRFESLNQGGLSGEQLAALATMKARYLILYENLFPEKVSPFPVTSTLGQFLIHPRLELLRQDGSVWAFKILDAPRPPAQCAASAPGVASGWDLRFPARRFEMEKTAVERRVTVKADPEAGGRRYVALAEPGSSLKTAPVRVAAVSNLHWLVRARGEGGLAGETIADQAATPLPPIPVRAADWTWLRVPVPAYEGFSGLSLKLALAEGAVDLDVCLLTAGPWPVLNPGEAMTLPAPLFFHAGHIDFQSGNVVFRRLHDNPGIVLYGPKLPLPKGTYAVEIAFLSPSPPGVELGELNLEMQTAAGEDVSPQILAIIAGQPARGQWRQEENLPCNLVVDYSAAADLEIRQVTITRLK